MGNNQNRSRELNQNIMSWVDAYYGSSDEIHALICEILSLTYKPDNISDEAREQNKRERERKHRQQRAEEKAFAYWMAYEERMRGK